VFTASKEKEEYVRVLDYLPYGRVDDAKPSYQKKPLIQAVGEKNFVLMELTPKKGKAPMIHERIYIGEGEREIVDHVNKRIKYNELTHAAQSELPHVLAEIVKDNEERFLDVYNKSYSITTRLHILDLFPGIGRKFANMILKERKKGDFKSFEDLTNRVKGLHHPEKIIANRIEEELREENVKYRLFTVK
jgi:putative nucleotide binding protein